MLTMTDVLRKTSAGRREQQQRSQTLSARQRHVLILCDGQRALGELCGLMGQEVIDLAHDLMQAGFVERVVPENAPQTAARGKVELAPSQVSASQLAQAVEQVSASQLAQAVAPPPRRSLVLARMYMFDMLERLLGAQSGPARAHLRAADQPQAVLSVLRECLRLIEELSGIEQAHKVRRQLCAMLPEDCLEGFVPSGEVTA
ncbi:MAG: hypothetical protein RBR52_08640 [Thiomonas sp.]|uniref:hypothetical protein n=1 Tax=Thiomonas sp. TaxID=2047785 RepID=UPI002A36409E|nr:hypothetical protein [Thiomonas sp.]MDY0330547.1 hypothetical protein [Thiomonas sp.]